MLLEQQVLAWAVGWACRRQHRPRTGSCGDRQAAHSSWSHYLAKPAARLAESTSGIRLLPCIQVLPHFHLWVVSAAAAPMVVVVAARRRRGGALGT